jgi:hypothetical protein
MKTYSKTYLPDSLLIAGQEYKVNFEASNEYKDGYKITCITRLKQLGEKPVLVKVMSKNLKGRTDLHGNPYKPSEWIFTPVNK